MKITFTKCLILLNLNHPYARTTLFLTCSEQKIFKRIISPFDFRTIFFDDYKASYKILSEITQGNKKNLKKLQEVLQLIWTHEGSLITDSSVIFHFNVQFFSNFDFSIFSILPFWGPFCQKKSLIFLHKTSRICLSSRFGVFWGCWFNFCFCEKTRTDDLFSGIWPLQRNLERILWVKMTSNLISKSRNGISIPKNPKNDYSKHIWDVFWRNIRDFFAKNGPQNGKIEKFKKSKLQVQYYKDYGEAIWIMKSFIQQYTRQIDFLKKEIALWGCN